MCMCVKEIVFSFAKIGGCVKIMGLQRKENVSEK